MQCKNVKNGGPEEDQLNIKMRTNFIQFICDLLSFILYLFVNVGCDYRT